MRGGTWYALTGDDPNPNSPGQADRVACFMPAPRQALKTSRVDSLYVASTAFPADGSANPSFMLMAFALRAAERIARELRVTAG